MLRGSNWLEISGNAKAGKFGICRGKDLFCPENRMKKKKRNLQKLFTIIIVLSTQHCYGISHCLVAVLAWWICCSYLYCVLLIGWGIRYWEWVEKGIKEERGRNGSNERKGGGGEEEKDKKEKMW